MPITIRTYRESDLESIVALINAADAFDKIEDGTSIEETRGWLTTPGMNPEENVFVAEDEGERIVGYAWVHLAKDAAESSFRCRFVVHPAERGCGLEERLLARQSARAEERLGECESPVVDFIAYANIRESEHVAILERFGLREARRFWMMVRPSLRDVPIPQFPSHIATRAYRVKEDDEKINAAVNEVFRDHWGHADNTLEQWQHYVSWSAFKPDLSVIAEDTTTGEVAGVCIVTVNAEENKRLGVERGWIDVLGVRRPYRKQGLGTALILAGLRNLREAGLAQAALGTDSENITGATRLYERAGFVVEKTRVAYRKRMRGASQ